MFDEVEALDLDLVNSAGDVPIQGLTLAIPCTGNARIGFGHIGDEMSAVGLIYNYNSLQLVTEDGRVHFMESQRFLEEPLEPEDIEVVEDPIVTQRPSDDEEFGGILGCVWDCAPEQYQDLNLPIITLMRTTCSTCIACKPVPFFPPSWLTCIGCIGCLASLLTAAGIGISCIYDCLFGGRSGGNRGEQLTPA